MSDPSRRLLQACHELVERTQPAGRLLGIGLEVAAIAMPDRSVVEIVSVRLGSADAIQAHLAGIVANNPGFHLKLVVIGGGPAERDAVRRARPKLVLGRAIQTFHLGDDGELWVGTGTRRDSPVGRALVRVAGGDLPEPDPVALARLVHATKPSPEQAAAGRERRAFVSRMRTGRLVATPAMLGLLALVYALQWWWGGGTTPAVLVRMGANTPASLSGEPQRLLASAFLHGGLLHLALNGWALYLLGGFVERLLGASRLLVLWVVAGAVGSLASALLGRADLSVGASGAICGLLGAAAVLAFRPEGILPDAVVPAIRRAALVNLLLTGSISLLPRVDLWAHLGGALAGAAVLAAMRPGLAGSSRPPHAPHASHRMRIVAAALVVLALVSLCLSIVQGRPWTLREPPTLVTRTIAPGVDVLVPLELGEGHAISTEPVQVVFGDLRRDPLLVIASVTPHDLDVRPPDEEVEAAGRALPLPPGTISGAWRRVPSAPAPTFEGQWAGEGVAGGGVWQLRERALVEVEVWWPSDAPEVTPAAGASILKALEAP